MSKLQRIENVLLFLTLLLIPTQLGKHFWPEFSYIFSLRIDYFSPTIYFWDILVVGLIAVWFLSKPKINLFSLNLLLIFLATSVLSLLKADNIGAGLVRLEQYVIAGFFGVYIASKSLVRIKDILFWGLSMAIIYEGLMAVGQFLKGGTLGLWILGERTFSITTPAIAKFDYHGIQFLRPYATFPHPNVLAAFMLISALILKLVSSRLTNEWIKRVSIFTASVAIALTVSRVAILASILSALILFNKKGRVLFLALLIILMPILYTRFSSVFNFDNLAIIRREELSEIALRLFWQSPFFGVGLNNFIPEASESLVAGPSRFLQPVHNIFLLTLAETGILGLLGIFGLLGHPIYKLIKGKAYKDKGKVILLAWALMIFLGLFDHYFLTLPQGLRLLFLIWGISLSVLEFKSEHS